MEFGADQLGKLREAFHMEAEERLDEMSQCLLEMEKTDEAQERERLLKDVFRGAHSLKGAARAVNLREVESLFQTLEEVLYRLQKGEVQYSAVLLDLFHQALSLVDGFLRLPEAESGQVSEQMLELDQVLLAVLAGEEPPETAADRAAGGGETPGPAAGGSSPLSGDVPQAAYSASPRNAGDDDLPSLDDFKAAGDDDIPSLADFGNAPGERNRPASGKKSRTSRDDLPSLADFSSPTPSDAPAAVGAEEPPKAKPAPASRPSGGKAKARPTSDWVRLSTARLDGAMEKAEELLSAKLTGAQHNKELAEVAQALTRWEKRWSRARQELWELQRRAGRGGEGSRAVVPDSIQEFLAYNETQIISLKQKVHGLAMKSAMAERALSRQVDDLLADLKEMTMLPFSTVSAAMPRMMRDISRQLNKEVDFSVSGDEIRIDRRILEEIKTPLIHLLRNAVDHGLESAGERAGTGKPKKGSVSLGISHAEGGRVEIVVSDDGRGMDPERIRAAAVKKGVISQKEADQLDDRASLSLIFRSQFTTSPIITEISGRGLGMDIVAQAVEKLGGLINIDTEKGKGTSFSILLPVSLATFRGVLVSVENRRFIMPCSQVEKVLRIPFEEISAVKDSAAVVLSGRTVGLVELSRVLGIAPENGKKRRTRYKTAVLAGSGDRRVAFCVDEVLSEQEVLVKSLGRHLTSVPNVAGATVLGNGRLVPVLNVRELMSAACGQRQGVSAPAAQERKRRILVVDDSITSRTLVKNILEAAGYQVKTAVNGQEALELVTKEAFDAVVSDVEMPRMTGLELTESIRAHAEKADTPVVLVTSLDSPEDRERGIAAGANAYIQKSGFDRNNLLSVVEQLV
ncbi:MAG: hybrid sensor histidine kinase/response regulator [Deltaproteobacteria bacterium]|nr:hybrid sensor histidine kinase/response regulator [Deltaproteobacteria bacterium]